MQSRADVSVEPRAPRIRVDPAALVVAPCIFPARVRPCGDLVAGGPAPGKRIRGQSCPGGGRAAAPEHEPSCRGGSSWGEFAELHSSSSPPRSRRGREVPGSCAPQQPEPRPASSRPPGPPFRPELHAPKERSHTSGLSATWIAPSALGRFGGIRPWASVRRPGSASEATEPHVVVRHAGPAPPGGKRLADRLVAAYSGLVGPIAHRADFSERWCAAPLPFEFGFVHRFAGASSDSLPRVV